MAEISRMTAVLDADIAPFTRGMADAVSATGQAVGSISKSISAIGEDFASLRSAVASTSAVVNGLLTALVGGIGAAAVIGWVGHLREGVKSIAEIAKSADAVGLTTDVFQELRYAAERSGVAQKEFSDVMKEFAERAFQARNGVGDLKTALDKYSPGATAAVAGTTSLSTAMLRVSDAVRAATNDQQRNAIVTGAFGKTNENLVQFLRAGSSEISRSAQAAREFGFVLDESIVRQAPEVQAKFDALVATIGANFQHVMIEAGPSVIRLADAVRRLLEQVVPAVEYFTKFTGAVADLVDISATADLGALNIKQLRDDLFAVNKQIEVMQWRMDGLKQGPTLVDRMLGISGPEAFEKDMNDLLAKRDEIEEAMQRRPQRTISRPSPVKFDLPDNKPSDSALAAAQKKLDAINAEFLKSTHQVTDGLRAEYDVQLRELQASLDKKLITTGDYIKARAQLEASLTAKLADEAQKQIKPVTDAISGGLTRAFDDFIDKGEVNFEQLTRSMIANLAKVALQMAIIQPLFGGGSTSGGGIVGSALAGIFHDGGIVGEGGGTRAVPGLAFATAPRFHSGGFPGMRAGEVPAILERGEQVIPKGGMAASGGRPIVFNITTPDVEGFRRSQGQIAAMVARTASRGQRNL